MSRISDANCIDDYLAVATSNAMDSIFAALSLPPRESEKEPEDETGTEPA